jgi:hypothetical protein
MLGAYDEPEAEPDVSATSSAAVRLCKRLAAGLLTRARSARNHTDAVAVGPGAAAPARCARRLRVERSRFILRLAMQHLPRVRRKAL